MRVGFIGAGNMAGAIIKGMVGSGFIEASKVIITDVNPSQWANIKKDIPVTIANDNIDLVNLCDMVILAVKPVYLRGVIDEIKPHVSGKSIVSIAAGWTVQMLKDAFSNSGCALLRVMPNTPALVGEGMTALCLEHTLTQEAFTFAQAMFESIGRVTVIPERMMDGFTAISGSSPAYIFMLMEAMADAGVKQGLPRSSAYEYAAQAVLGSAKMVLATGEHPAVLKDMVCSPSGATIEAVASLEDSGFRAAIIKAMDACALKSKEMSK